jgi:hypothetical protein
LTTNDDVDNGKTASDEDVENRAQFGAPEAKGISGCSDSTETKLEHAVSEGGSKGRESGRPRNENRELSNLWSQRASVSST